MDKRKSVVDSLGKKFNRVWPEYRYAVGIRSEGICSSIFIQDLLGLAELNGQSGEYYIYKIVKQYSADMIIQGVH